jgi:hypothetical protein
MDVIFHIGGIEGERISGLRGTGGMGSGKRILGEGGRG